MFRLTLLLSMVSYAVFAAAYASGITVNDLTNCGYRKLEGVDIRVTRVNENEADYGEYPWTVGILQENELRDGVVKVYRCVGSLIHPSVVLTAAQCVSGQNASTLLIRAGEWNTRTKDEIFPHQDLRVSEYITHEQYDRDAFMVNDVALLFLEKSVEPAEHVNTICLPPPDQNFDLQRCFASGWGKNVSGIEGRYQTIMKRVELPVVPRDKCLTELKKTNLGQDFELHSSFICAGGESGIDTCKGDEGAPLVCPIPNTRDRYYQAGIVSRFGCGSSAPGVYVNVPLYRNWIEEKLQLRGIYNASFVPA